MRTDSGQAMMEFIIGIFALTLLISAFLVIGEVIPKAAQCLSFVRFNAGKKAFDSMGSESQQNDSPMLVSILRNVGAPYSATPMSYDTLRTETDVDAFSALYIFGDEKFRTRESAYFPVLRLPQSSQQLQLEHF